MKSDRSEEKKNGPWDDLTEAARGLAHELRRFEEGATAARRMPLDTQKAIERAAKATTETAAGQERVDLALGTVVQAIKAARERHEANAAALQTRGEEIRRRAEQFGALYERWSALGEEGRIINQLVQEAAVKQRDSAPETARELAAAILGVEERMARLIDGARDLGQAATLASITDLAEQASSLRQQVAAARNKITLLRKSLPTASPDASELN
jgi:chromosome segregation ATPase